MEEHQADAAPASIGSYSQGIKDGDRIYVSGQGPVDPGINEIIEGDINEETAGTSEHLSVVLQSSGCSLEYVFKAMFMEPDIQNYDAINETHTEYLHKPHSSGSVVEVEDLPIDIGVVIEVVD